VQAVAKANLNQPRYASHARTNVRGLGTSSQCRHGEDQRDWPSNSQKQPISPPGYWGWHVRKEMRFKLGTHSPTECWTDEENKPFGVQASGADEAIVSDDLTGQHNQSESQGPLDESVRTAKPARHAFGPQGEVIRTWAQYKWRFHEGLRRHFV